MGDYERGRRRIKLRAEVTIHYDYVFEAPEGNTASDEDLLDRVRRYVTCAHDGRTHLSSLSPLVQDMIKSYNERSRDPVVLHNIVLREERWHEKRIGGVLQS